MVHIYGEPKEKKQLKEIFQTLDKNNDGILSKEEFSKSHIAMKTFIIDCKWDTIYNCIDLDKDGQIDIDEFVTAAANHVNLITEDNIKRAFSLFDKNGDQFIDQNEFLLTLPEQSQKSQKEYSGSDTPGVNLWKAIL